MKRIFTQTIFTISTFLIPICVSGQIINTFAGIPSQTYSGDGGPAINAGVNGPVGIATDQAGNVYIADKLNHRVRKVSPSGIITTIAGNGNAAYSGDGGLAINAELNNPSGVAVDAAGNIYISDRTNNRIRKINLSGIISTYAGNGTGGFSGDGGAATSAQIYYPFGLYIDGGNNLYIADVSNQRVRKVTPTGTITTFAGNGIQSFGGDGGPANIAQLDFPFGVTGDAVGNIYIADQGNNRIRKVDITGTITTFAGSGVAGFSGDNGPAVNAKIWNPASLVMSSSGILYIGDLDNERIRIVNSNSVITTYAGNGIAAFAGDGGPALNASFNKVYGIALDASGNLYLADQSNNRIRKITCAQPTINITSSNSLICVGQTSTITVSGANTYTWNQGGNGQSIIISPSITTTYSVTGTNSITGCTNSNTVTQNVSPCTSVLYNELVNDLIKIYPNPAINSLNIHTVKPIDVILIMDILGRKVLELNENATQINIEVLPKGIYQLLITSEGKSYTSKFIKE